MIDRSVSIPVADLGRVTERVKRPVEGLEDAVVDDLQDDHQSEEQTGGHGHDPSRCAGQDEGQRDHDQQLERQPQKTVQVQVLRLVGSDERHPYQQRGDDRERDRHALAPVAVTRGRIGLVTRARLHDSGLQAVTVAAQPRHIVPERLGEQDQRADQRARGHGRRQDVGRGDGQHDSLRRGDELAPVARRQRLAHPGQHPAGGAEHVARRADREHPGADPTRDVDAEDEDQKRVDLAVEARAQGPRRLGAPRDPSVDRIEHERDRRQRHDQRHPRGLAERVRDQRRDANGQRGPEQGHPVGRAHAGGAVVGEPARQRCAGDRPAADSDRPGRRAEAGATESNGDRKSAEEQELGDQNGDRGCLNDSHGASLSGGGSHRHYKRRARRCSSMPVAVTICDRAGRSGFMPKHDARLNQTFPAAA